MKEDRQLCEVKKNSKEVIRVVKTEYQGTELVDVRTYYEDSEGEYQPSRKGIALTRTVLPEVVRALREAMDNGKENTDRSE